MGNKKRALGLSLVTAMLLGSSAYAGKIITDADVENIVVTENQQFGFGGWNFDNVKVKITDLEYNEISNTFNADGTYGPMASGDSFESELNDINYSTGTPIVGTTVMGRLHGKDWPVGEPSGIKIINDDTKVKHGKPVNCIMTSSYQEFRDDLNNTGYLNAFEESAQPNPVLCSSPWQTHKRFKINIQPIAVADPDTDGAGKPIDLVFNLDPTDTNATARRYQVLQKANNYSDKRLKGYKIEVLDENGSKNPALTLSLGEGEGDAGANIWDPSDMANMSHGLWGPYEEGRFENGFFDYIRAYYPVVLSDNNQTISYTGDMQGGNYQAIFGNWLPSIWEPMGIFHDDDENPETDGILKAFFGNPDDTKFTEDAWYKSSVVYDPATPEVKPVYTWSLATDADFLEWSGDWYNVGAVEDVLNLGLNYIVNVGDNALIGKTFTIRITPYVDSDQREPTYVDKNSSIPTPPPPADDTIAPVITLNGSKLMFVVQGGTFTDPGATATDDVDGTVPVTTSGTVDTSTAGSYTLTYTATDAAQNTATETRTVLVVAEEVVDSITSSSSGGGCTYNPNSTGFDMTLLFMMALAGLYPFRRRFLK